MNVSKKIIFLLLISNSIFASDIYESISNSIKTGDAKQLSQTFGNSIDLTIIDQENVYSKSQAELIIKDFFSKNPPKSFSILHKGSSPEGTQYVIGTLETTNNKTFRISFYLKNNEGKNILHELRIENK